MASVLLPLNFAEVTYATSDNDYKYAFEVFNQVNQERAKVGVAPLKMDKELLDASMIRSDELTILYNHSRPGSQKEWYSVAPTKAHGENIAAGQTSPSAVMQTWMNSPGHRANILNSGYKSMGVGYVYNPTATTYDAPNDVYRKYSHYWTQLFSRSEATNSVTLNDVLGTTTGENGNNNIGNNEYSQNEVKKYGSDLSIILKPQHSITINTAKSGGLKKAIEEVQSGGIIYLEKGVYKGLSNTNITINKNVIIAGKGSNVIFDGQGKNRIFKTTKNSIVTLINITITNGRGTARGYSTTLSYSDARSGGAIENNGTVIIANSTIKNNDADYGGAIYNNNGTLMISNSYFKSNIAGKGGGAIFSEGWRITRNINGSNPLVSIINSTFEGNIAGEYNGGAICTNNIEVILINSSFKNNNAGYWGGAINLERSIQGIDEIIRSRSAIINSTFENNKAKYNGGAIFLSNHDILINKVIFNNNKAMSGGAIYSYDRSNISIINSKFEKNEAIGSKLNDDGGAICMFATVLNLINTTFTNNNAPSAKDIFNRYSTVIYNKQPQPNVFSTQNAIISYNPNLNVKYSLLIPTFKINFQQDTTEPPRSGKNKYNFLKVLNSKATVNRKNVDIQLVLDKSKSKNGATVVKLETPENIIHKNLRVSIGSTKYNKRSNILTWTISNNVLFKQQASIKLVLETNKKGNYKLTPLISSTENIIIDNKDITFRIC